MGGLVPFVGVDPSHRMTRASVQRPSLRHRLAAAALAVVLFAQAGAYAALVAGVASAVGNHEVWVSSEPGQTVVHLHHSGAGRRHLHNPVDKWVLMLTSESSERDHQAECHSTPATTDKTVDVDMVDCGRMEAVLAPWDREFLDLSLGLGIRPESWSTNGRPEAGSSKFGATALHQALSSTRLLL